MKLKKRDITFSRKNTEQTIHIFCDGKRVGNIIHSLTTPRKFILEFNEVYYSGNGRIRLNSGGHTGNWSKTLQETYMKVDAILSMIEVRPYPEPVVRDGRKA